MTLAPGRTDTDFLATRDRGQGRARYLSTWAVDDRNRALVEAPTGASREVLTLNVAWSCEKRFAAKGRAKSHYRCRGPQDPWAVAC
eukprot:4873184-Pleurochrysis_carterae.AAC.2